MGLTFSRRGLTASYETAIIAGQNAGNANMRKGGRSVWNEDDQEAAIRAFWVVLELAQTSDARA